MSNKDSQSCHSDPERSEGEESQICHSERSEESHHNYNKNKALYYWTSFPAIDHPKKTVMVGIIILITAYILWQLAIVEWDQPLYYVLGIIILFISLAPYFVPTSYYFFEDGFLVQYPFVKIEKKYTEYGCFYSDKMGFMLSTYKKPRRMDAFRGQSFRYSKTKIEKEEIMSFLEEKITRK